MIDAESAHINLSSVRAALAANRSLWNFGLIDADSLHRLSADKGINIFDGETVRKLWAIGLLRADCVESTGQDLEGLVAVDHESGATTYCDRRLPKQLPEGYGGALSREAAVDATPMFHPYRLYVLHHVERVFRLRASSTQYLSWPSGIGQIAEREAAHLDEWTRSNEFREQFDHWNRVAELAIALEPLASGPESGLVLQHAQTDSHRAELAVYRHQAERLVVQLGLLGIRDVREELGRTAEWIDENRNLHVLLRLMSVHERRKLRGALGCSMQLLSMAEVIRRTAERVFGQQLPEEDQIGLGTWFKGARQLVYGTERVFDAPRRVLRDYLTSMGLDFGTKVRCYVEGATELAALSSAFGDASGIEFVNLRASVVERGGRGLSFADSIKSDATAHVFSVVMIDGDRTDDVRVLRKAAEEPTFLGRYFVSEPDVELANFTASELLEIVIEQTRCNDPGFEVTAEVRDAVLYVRSAGEFFELVSTKLGVHLRKGESWGRALMRLAIAAPTLPPTHRDAGKQRPLIEAADMLTRALRSGYVRSAASSTVDAQTGRLKTRGDLSRESTSAQ
jgi:hypothetical protein